MKTKQTIIAIILILFVQINLSNGQSSVFGNLGTAGDYLGWDNFTAIPLDIRHNNTANPQNIDFYTDSTFQMTILGNNVYNNGFVGVGLSLPRLKFEVNNNIGVIPQTWEEGYFIDSFAVLRVWPDPLLGRENLFVGIGAGYNAANSGQLNTFVGHDAGMSNTTGSLNTFTGRQSGNSNTTGEENSFYGVQSGRNNTSGTFNTFIGNLSGQGTVDGFENTAVGYRAYSSSPAGTNNSIFGANAALMLDSAELNVVVGAASAGNLEIGNRNVIIGARTLPNAVEGHELVLLGNQSDADDGLTNATAIGANAWVRNNNQMILGDTGIFVGIGLSGDATGPQNTLEINTSSGYTPGVVGNSGLRFSDLRSASATSTGNGKVLTVNATGDVILVPDNDGGTVTSSCGTSGYLPRMNTSTNVVCSQLYDNATNVGIGVGASPNSAMKVHMQGDMYVQHNMGAGTPKGGDIFMNDASGNVERVLSMYGTGGYGAVSIGHFAGNSQTQGSGSSSVSASVFVGREAGTNISSSSSHNTFVGSKAGEDMSASTGNANTIMGSVAGQNMTDGEKNVIIGYSAANGSGSNLLADGDFNVFIGAEVQNNTLQAATRNVVIGTNAAVVNDNSSTTAADRNVVVGHNAIAQDILGTVNPDEINYSGVFGSNTTVGCDSCIVVGNNAIHRVGIGLTMPGRNTMLDVNPRGGQTFSAVFRSLDIQSNGITVPSDANLKDNLQPLTSVSNALSQLNTYSYNYKHNDFPQIGLDDKPHYGFLAQEVEAVFPQLVTNFTTDPYFDSLGVQTHAAVQTKGIRYLEIIPLLLQGFKEQKNNLDSLKQQVQDLTQQLNNCCGNPQPMPINGDNTLHRANVSLSNNEIIVLNQNSPNPFKDKTEITYILPVTVKDAVILFYDQSGKVLQKFDISHRGAGSLTVYGEDLTSGVYTYSLIIDGENHQTKRMVKQ